MNWTKGIRIKSFTHSPQNAQVQIALGCLYPLLLIIHYHFPSLSEKHSVSAPESVSLTDTCRVRIMASVHDFGCGDPWFEPNLRTFHTSLLVNISAILACALILHSFNFFNILNLICVYLSEVFTHCLLKENIHLKTLGCYCCFTS